MYHKRDRDTFGLCGAEDLTRIHSRGDQTIALHGRPPAGEGGAVIGNPLHLPFAITRRDLRRSRSALQAIREAQHFAGGRWRTLSRMASSRLVIFFDDIGADTSRFLTVHCPTQGALCK